MNQQLRQTGEFITENDERLPIIEHLRDAIKPGWESGLIDKTTKEYIGPTKELFENKKRKSLIMIDMLKRCGYNNISNKDLLEVGCYMGTQCFALAELGINSIKGIDIPEGITMSGETSEKVYKANMDLLNRKRDDLSEFFNPYINSLVEFEDSDICKLNEKEKYDIIFSHETFEHIHNPKLALINMYNALKPDGICFHEYNPFFSFTGGHSLCTTDIPFGHIRLSKNDYDKYIKQYRPNEYKLDMNYYNNNLNRMCLEDFRYYIDAAGFEVLSFITLPNMNNVQYIDADLLKQVKRIYPKVELNDFICDTVITILRKK